MLKMSHYGTNKWHGYFPFVFDEKARLMQYLRASAKARRYPKCPVQSVEASSKQHGFRFSGDVAVFDREAFS